MDMMKPKQGKIMTTTTLIIEALRLADDFMTSRQLAFVTRRSINQVWAALLHLRRKHAVDAVIQDKDSRNRPVSYWYALPEEEDEREWTLDEYTPAKRKPHVRRTKKGKIIKTQ